MGLHTQLSPIQRKNHTIDYTKESFLRMTASQMGQNIFRTIFQASD